MCCSRSRPPSPTSDVDSGRLHRPVIPCCGKLPAAAAEILWCSCDQSRALTHSCSPPSLPPCALSASMARPNALLSILVRLGNALERTLWDSPPHNAIPYPKDTPSYCTEGQPLSYLSLECWTPANLDVLPVEPLMLFDCRACVPSWCCILKSVDRLFVCFAFAVRVSGRYVRYVCCPVLCAPHLCHPFSPVACRPVRV